MENNGFILVLWRVNESYNKEEGAEKLFNELHNPKILSIAEIVDVVEIHTPRDPIELLARWERGEAVVYSLLAKNNPVIDWSDKHSLDTNNALTIAIVREKIVKDVIVDVYDHKEKKYKSEKRYKTEIYISALTRLFKPLTGALDRNFEHKVLKNLKMRTGNGFALSSLVWDIEACDEQERANCKIPADKWGNYSEEDINIFETMLLYAYEIEAVGTECRETDHFKKPEDKDNVKAQAKRKYWIPVHGYELGKVGHRYWIKKEGQGRNAGYWILK